MLLENRPGREFVTGAVACDIDRLSEGVGKDVDVVKRSGPPKQIVIMASQHPPWSNLCVPFTQGRHPIVALMCVPVNVDKVEKVVGEDAQGFIEARAHDHGRISPNRKSLQHLKIFSHVMVPT